jgi:hypothetical protein
MKLICESGFLPASSLASAGADLSKFPPARTVLSKHVMTSVQFPNTVVSSDRPVRTSVSDKNFLAVIRGPVLQPGPNVSESLPMAVRMPLSSDWGCWLYDQQASVSLTRAAGRGLARIMYSSCGPDRKMPDHAAPAYLRELVRLPGRSMSRQEV